MKITPADNNKSNKASKCAKKVTNCSKNVNRDSTLETKNNSVLPKTRKPLNSQILNTQTQTDFSSQDSIQENAGEFISLEGVPCVEFRQYDNNLIQNNDLYPHTEDEKIDPNDIYINGLKESYSECSIEFDKLSSDASDHQFDYDYQHPTEHYIRAYDLRNSPCNNFDLRTIDEAIRRNTINLRAIEKDNELYDLLEQASKNPLRSEKCPRTVEKENVPAKKTNPTKTKLNQAIPRPKTPISSPKLTGKPSMIPKFEVKTYVSSVSYENVTEIKKQHNHKNNIPTTKTLNSNKNFNKTRTREADDHRRKK